MKVVSTFEFKTEQKALEIPGVRIGENRRENPVVLTGGIFC